MKHVRQLHRLKKFYPFGSVKIKLVCFISQDSKCKLLYHLRRGNFSGQYFMKASGCYFQSHLCTCVNVWLCTLDHRRLLTWVSWVHGPFCRFWPPNLLVLVVVIEFSKDGPPYYLQKGKSFKWENWATRAAKLCQEFTNRIVYQFNDRVLETPSGSQS